MLFGGGLHIHPQESAYLLRRVLLHLGGDVAVGIQGEPSGIMPKQARQCLHIHTILECQCCEGVAQIVEPNAFVQPDCLQDFLMQPGDGLRTPDATGSGRGEQVDAVRMIFSVLHQ